MDCPDTLTALTYCSTVRYGTVPYGQSLLIIDYRFITSIEELSLHATGLATGLGRPSWQGATATAARVSCVSCVCCQKTTVRNARFKRRIG